MYGIAPWVHRHFFNEEGGLPDFKNPNAEALEAMYGVAPWVQRHFFNEEGGQKKDFAHPT